MANTELEAGTDPDQATDIDLSCPVPVYNLSADHDLVMRRRSGAGQREDLRLIQESPVLLLPGPGRPTRPASWI